MAHLWIYSSPDWTARLLTGDRFTLNVTEEPPVRPLAADEVVTGRIVLRRTTDSDGGDNWLLLASLHTTVWVNGRPLFTGARLLRDKDEIRLQDAEPMFFSTEMLARVTAFPGTVRPAHCPRCRQVIKPGSPAVQCPNPGCRMWHHQAAGYECWTYGATCAVCDQPTALDAGYRWIPEKCVP